MEGEAEDLGPESVPRETVHFGAAEAARRFPTFHASQAAEAAAAAADAEPVNAASSSPRPSSSAEGGEEKGEDATSPEEVDVSAPSPRRGPPLPRAPEYRSECGFVMSSAWPEDGEYVPRGCWGCLMGARASGSPPDGGTRVFYRIHTNMDGPACLPESPGRPHRKYLLLMGVAASCEAWDEQVAALCAPGMPDTSVLCVENRGIGFSDAPEDVNGYSLATFGRDALSCMDAVGWDAGGVHVVGFSMGGMVALELSLRIAPERFASCCAVSSSRAGKRALPLCVNVPVLLGPACAKTPAERARADLACHFSKDTLEDPAMVERLMASYVARSEHGRRVGKVRSKAGEAGQVQAVVQSNRIINEGAWTKADGASASSGGKGAALEALPLPILLVHGTEDKIAPFANSLEMAAILRCRLVALPAGHMVPFERPAMLSAEIHAHAEAAEHLLLLTLRKRGQDPHTSPDDKALGSPHTRTALGPSVGPIHPDGPDPALCSKLVPLLQPPHHGNSLIA